VAGGEVGHDKDADPAVAVVDATAATLRSRKGFPVTWPSKLFTPQLRKSRSSRAYGWRRCSSR
jgi:hypothetical protein